MFLLQFMTLQYPLVIKVQLKLFQEQCNSLIKKVFLIYKNGKALKK